MNDQEFLDKIRQTDTPKEILALILENEDLLGYDPYYADLRKAMLQRAQCILQETQDGD